MDSSGRKDPLVNYSPDYVESLHFQVYYRGLEWTQNVEGFSIADLDKAIALVTRHGIKVAYLLSSRPRADQFNRALHKAGLMEDLHSQHSNFPVFCRQGAFSYKGIYGLSDGPFLWWNMVPDSEVYVVGETEPPTPESVAVLTLRRPVTKEI